MPSVIQVMELWPLYNEQQPNWRKRCKKKRAVCFVCKRKKQQKQLKVPFSVRNYSLEKKKKKKKMASQQMFKSGQARGEGQAKADQMMDSAQSTADAARSKASRAAQSAQQSKEHAGGMLQQTGEQVMNMAQGAMDSVKNTLGIGDKKS